MDDITEQYIENLLNTQYELGKVCILESLPNVILDKAAEYFKNGDDKTANIFRNLAKELDTNAKERRKQYENKEHKEHKEIWSILDEAIPDLDWSK